LRRALVVLAILAVFALPVGAAGAAGSQSSSQEQQIKVLQQQVKVLQKQVKALRKQVKIATAGVDFAIAAITCSAAITVDTFQATWNVLNGSAGWSEPPFTNLTPVPDYGACAAISSGYKPVERTPAEKAPTLSAFKTLLYWLYG
jgi:hypothetical protein